MQAIATIRDVSGLSQLALAEAASTSQPTIAQYERGRKSPTWRTIERVAHSVGLECQVTVGEPMTRDERRSLHLHRAIVSRLHADPTSVIEKAALNLTRMRRSQPGAAPLLDEWAKILQRDSRAIASRLLDASEHGRALRQVTPFAGVLDTRQRAAVYRAFRDAA